MNLCDVQTFPIQCDVFDTRRLLRHFHIDVIFNLLIHEKIVLFYFLLDSCAECLLNRREMVSTVPTVESPAVKVETEPQMIERNDHRFSLQLDLCVRRSFSMGSSVRIDV